ncbi:MAG: hypothetical protein WCP31_02270 [Chloroflexales bacterium]
MDTHFATWRAKNAMTLRQVQVGCHPKAVIASLAEDLLAHCIGQPLIDPYAVYQRG